jgi:hypothetical protein
MLRTMESNLGSRSRHDLTFEFGSFRRPDPSCYLQPDSVT